ncbi:exocyst complex component EXO70B1 [Ricinus communis]|uniref:Exocyst subunit Exo70 family protein n=1 Tax=Ricinus communis TaxID=3988 RepID=B9RM96_RICCO|nr:exocyst complex component EXO70B1 [Ricinus communis]EEF47419.1 protein binding protein, putative [Ricinus communis]|eukprot:XP_002514865.1 exocyst complex component EXO70B1 [Ricinus communis]
MDATNNPPETVNGIAPNEQQDATNSKSDSQQEHSGESDHKRNIVAEESSSFPEFLSLSQALEDVDRFVDTLSRTDNDKSNNPLEVPNCVESLLKMVEKKMSDYDSNRFGDNPDEDSSFFDCLSRISKLINAFNRFTHDPTIAASLNRASTVLHMAVSLLDSEFRAILDICYRNNNNNNTNNNADSKTPKALKATSFSLHHQDSGRTVQSELESTQEEEFPAYSQESITLMNKIATAMISLGYKRESCMAYNMIRRYAFNTELDKLGFNNISIEDVQKIQWDALEGEIAAWNDVLKHCYSILFPSEQKLCDSIFSEYPSISQRLFSDLALAVTVRFLNFAEAVALTKRSAEKLFKFLDMYETLRDIIPAIYSIDSDELKSETSVAKSRLGEAAVSIFCNLENSIRRDHSKTPVPSGAVHPLTRYTMNYLKYACEYKDTLEQVFLQHKIEASAEATSEATEEIKIGANDDGTPKTSPFAVQLNMVMDLLDENLEMKSKLYRDPALRFVFLMNNGRYILQKIKGSNEINDIMGATWCRKRSTDLRQYHKGYTRETWGKLLQCLVHEGLQVNGKVAKPVLKERFKMFNSMFDEIHKTQSTWVVSDEQLQSELRVSVSAVVIPAYRSFLGRFQQYFSSGRQTEKYIKYQPEDIENLIDELFDGNPNSMARRRT